MLEGKRNEGMLERRAGGTVTSNLEGLYSTTAKGLKDDVLAASCHRKRSRPQNFVQD